MRAYILRTGGPGNRTQYPAVASAMLYQLSYRRPSSQRTSALTFPCIPSKTQTKWLPTLIVVIVHLSVRVGRLPVLRVVPVQVGELREQLEHTLPVVVQVGHLTVEQV